MTSTKEFALTRSIYPYSLYIIICFGGLIYGLVYWFHAHDISFVAADLLLSALTAAMLYGDTRYRIFWNDREIKQVSVNKYLTVIRASDITRVVQERSDLKTRFQLRRPADRISIYGGHGDEEKHIDVSLRHFVATDIRKLMQAIHDRRPDLTLPNNWL